MSENGDSTIVREKTQSKLPGWAIWGLVLLLAFLLGFVPMWLKSRTVSQELHTTQKQLRKTEIKNLLTTAIVEAKNGEYETARQNASEFFTNLDAEIAKGEQGSLTTEQSQKLKPIFTNRDTMITLLAQRDPASVERLTDIYAIYKQAFGEMQTRTPVPLP